MKTHLIYLFLIFSPTTIRGRCTFSPWNISCVKTTQENFLRYFYEHCNNSYMLPTYRNGGFKIKIEDSSFNQIEYFPKLFLPFHDFDTTSLVIKNSSVETIRNNALEELIKLQYLDLSWNKLGNILFVQHLSSQLEELYLSNNNIIYVDDVFDRLLKLSILDLSCNKISVFNFPNELINSRSSIRLNFSHNVIETLIPLYESPGVIYELNLSYNNITSYNEIDLVYHNIYNLDISHNLLKHVRLAGGPRNIVKLSENRIESLKVGKDIAIRHLDLSSTSDFSNLTDILRVPVIYMVLRNNNIKTLKKSVLNINGILYSKSSIDLFNCSIHDISPYYFEGIQLNLLNLSNNNITILGNNVFLQSKISTLDLSNANIEHIQLTTFKNFKAETINLKRNRLVSVKGVFDEVEVERLDLSFNKFIAIVNRSFFNSHGVLTLNLDHCLIEKIEPEAFFGLTELQYLILSNNKLFILETNSFSNLPITALQLEGNEINTVRSKAFNGLNNLKLLNLSRVLLCNIEPYAFNNLSYVEVLDLSYNNVTTIPHYLLSNVDNLKVLYLEGNNITTLNLFSTRIKMHTVTLSFSGIFGPNKVLNLNIYSLHIKQSKIDVLKNDSFAGFYNLMNLDFTDSYTYVETGALNNLFNLRHLDSQSLFKHMTVIRQSTFKDLRSLGHLDLSKLSLETLEMGAFAGMIQLETLLLNDNYLSDLQGYTFYGLNSLRVLNLSNSSVNTCDENSFMGLESLEVLHLEYNNLTEIKSNFLFKSLSSLLELRLEHNNISSLHVKSFSRLTKLKLLHLQDNNIEELPIGVFQYLSNLMVLNLSNNKIQLLKTGSLSNLGNLKNLDLSNNNIVNLEYVDIFFSLKQLETVLFNGNHLKHFDFRRFLINLGKIRYVGISYNKWNCDTLSSIIESLNNRSIDYKPEAPVFDDDNIDGVGCVDTCKFVFCSHENVEQPLYRY